MARSSNGWGFSLKVLLVSTLVVTIAVTVKLSAPLLLQFILSEIPLLWRCILSWLTPPYLYVVINGIIITIAASSRFHQKLDDEPQPAHTFVAPLKLPHPMVDFSVYDSVALKTTTAPVLQVRADNFGSYEADLNNNVSNYDDNKEGCRSEGQCTPAVLDKEDDGFVISRSNWTPSTRVSTEIPILPEKPPVSVRFSHRRTSRPTPEGVKALGVAKPKRNDTLESTWKTITDGRPIPLARHLKKSDTWEAHGRHHHHTAAAEEAVALSPKMKKSETFQDRSTNSPLLASPGSGKLKKDPSLGQDELNRRVEAFIKKFNEEMRLQRQESLNHYKEMVARS